MKVEENRQTDKENMIDIRLRKGVSGGDEFIHYIENVKEEQLENTLEKEFPVICNKINAELRKMGFDVSCTKEGITDKTTDKMVPPSECKDKTDVECNKENL